MDHKSMDPVNQAAPQAPAGFTFDEFVEKRKTGFTAEDIPKLQATIEMLSNNGTAIEAQNQLFQRVFAVLLWDKFAPLRVRKAAMDGLGAFKLELVDTPQFLQIQVRRAGPKIIVPGGN